MAPPSLSQTGRAFSIRSAPFWISALALGSLSMLVTGMFFHQVSILDVQGLDPQTAASVFSVSALGMVAFMPVLGRLLDRVRTQSLFSLTMLVMAAALAVLSTVSGVVTAMAYAVVVEMLNLRLRKRRREPPAAEV